MQKVSSIVFLFAFVTGIFLYCTHNPGKEFTGNNIREKTEKTLLSLDSNLLSLQITDTADEDFGAIRCPHCHVLHTRAGEAVYPFARAYQITGDLRFLRAAIRLGNWLIRQQQKDGSWLETPEEWTGTTTDQLLMMDQAYLIVGDKLNDTERKQWLHSLSSAAGYLVNVMDPGFASINYCATTAASLAMTFRIIPDRKYLDKARDLAHHVAAKMDDAGFITGEGGRVYGIKYGVDLGYDLDMSLWGLALYAQTTNDAFIYNKVKEALKNHVDFIYPDGSVDGSWGIRSNKWTTFGSATADGCQVLFALYDSIDPVYRSAYARNLEYLKKNIRKGWVGYGPQYWEIFDTPPCIYPTFVRAKNLAMASLLLPRSTKAPVPLPTDQPGFFRYFPTVDVILARTRNFMGTITAYRYKDPKGRKSKYMHRPTGGAMSYLWLKGHGVLQASSQTLYKRWEPMHFPPAEGILPLTSRIEYRDSTGYFTNLYDFEGNLRTENEHVPFLVTTSGELRNEDLKAGGIAYSLTHEMGDDYIRRSVKIRYHDHAAAVRIIEPFIHFKGMVFKRVGPDMLNISGRGPEVLLKVLSKNVSMRIGKDADKYWSPYPALKAYPVVLEVNNKPFHYEQTVVYEIRIVNK